MLAGVICSLGFGLSALLAVLIPGICWTPRIGGLLVGFAVFIQAYMFANPNKFNHTFNNKITIKQYITHVIYVLTIFGTLLWAFGDLLPEVIFVSNSVCHIC